MPSSILRASSIPAVLSFLLLAGGAESYSELTDGDLSSDPAAPTAVTFSAGSNLVTGSVAAPGDIRDFLTFSIGAGQALTAIQLVSSVDGTTGGPPDRGFVALHPGATSAIPGAGTIGCDQPGPVPGRRRSDVRALRGRFGHWCAKASL